MRDQPDVDQLLTASRDALLQQILPAVPAALEVQVLMIANALAIARRTLAAGDAPLQRELGALQAIYALPGKTTLTGAALESSLLALNQRLARDIRAGRFDCVGTRRDAVRRLLKECVIQKLRESKPKFVTESP